MQEYVVGFAFGRVPEKFSTHVVLIKKNRPARQAGLLNGVGGKIERKDRVKSLTPHYVLAMRREFREETGVETMVQDWHLFAKVSATSHFGKDKVCVYYLRAEIDINGVEQTTDEQIVKVPVLEIGQTAAGRAMPDLKWLIPMAITHGQTADPQVYDIRLP